MSSRQAKTVGAVTIVHVVAVGLICAWGVFESLRRIELDTVRIRLVNAPRPVTEESAGVERPDATRREPTPAEPAPDPTTAVQETAPGQETPDVVPAPPKWQARSVEEIRQAAKLREVRPNSAPPARPSPTVDASAIAQRLQRSVRNVSANIALPNDQSAPANQDAAKRYLGVVSRALYKAWDQPTRSDVGRQDPGVAVRLTIRRDGRVASSQIIGGGSGSSVMDASVERALRRLNKLAPFEGFGLTGNSLTITVRFELD